MKSFGILRTNTGLSTNMKIVIDSEYGLFMESIDSATELSSSKFKKVRFNKENYFDEMIPYFYKTLPQEIAFTVKYKDDNDNLFNHYDEQYDDIYQMGARNITDNKNFKEEYEFFAPIYFNKGSFPKYFALFRVDGPGLIDLTKDNFKSEIINKLKCVKLFDLTKNSKLGEWIEKNFLRNDLFPDTPLEVDFRTDEFTKWNGIDYKTGGYTYKSLFLNDTFEYENTIFDLEKFIFDGYAKNGVVFPNILNLSFLFDDTPATKTSLRKWSINRYFGFYLENIDLVSIISPYLPVKLKSDIYIDPSNKNTLRCSSSTYPFDDNKSDADFSKKDYYVEYLGNFYKVEQYLETQPRVISRVPRKKGYIVEEFSNPVEYRYRIISDIDLTGKESLLNKNICLFDSNNYIIRYSDYSYFDIPEFDTADVWIIEIDGKYHNLVKEDGKIRVSTDYGFDFSIDKYSYFINNVDSSYTTTVSLVVDKDNAPKNFKIYRVNFTDIKDFDTSIIDTEFSKYEYEKYDEITNTDETKLHFPDLRSKSFPNDIDDFKYKGEVVNIPTSSEYTANLETFRIVNNDLSEIWRKNPVHCRWGFQNSLSANDYPYLLNNSDLFEDYNRTVNPFLPIPSRIERNLDHFYTINSSTSSYVHHSLHVEDHIGVNINTDFQFELEKYLNTENTSGSTYSSDYFSYFFGKKSLFKSGEVLKNTKKYSFFNRGDKDIPNVSLFRGIKFSIFDVDNIKYEDGKLTNINLKNTNTFDDYKFSVLLSDNKKVSSTTICSNFSVVKFSMIVFIDPSLINIGDIVEITSSECGFEDIEMFVESITDNIGSSIITLMNGGGDPIAMPANCDGTICFTHNSTSNGMNWLIVDEWDSRQTYGASAIVVHDDILYQTSTQSGPINVINDNFVSPYNYPNWAPYYHPAGVTYSLLWNPSYSYVSDDDIVFNSGEYYKNDFTGGGTISFWNPYSGGYGINDIVLYKSDFWISKTSSNTRRPSTTTTSRVSDTEYWEKTSGYESSSQWKLISLWDFNKTYSSGEYVVQDNVVFRCILASTNNATTDSTYWTRTTSIAPDTNVIYNVDNNPVISMDDKYYIIRENSTNSTLENGVNIYINHKWKNVLVNIAIDDNTIKNISHTDRDDLYGFSLYQRNKVYTDGLESPVNTKLTAINLINCINDITTKYGFTDYLNYYIIGTDGSIKSYNYENLSGLPHMIKCDFPDEFNIRVDSLKYEAVEYPSNSLKPNRVLKSGEIDNITHINYYNNLLPAYKISKNEEFRTNDNAPQRILSKNTHGIINIINNNVYRHSGYYMPIFYDIELFERPGITASIYGNYKFDTTLTNFGKMKQRVISKVNTKNNNILKLKNRTDYRSIYPMLDEFGYTTVDFFIFKSTWDYKYHIECSENLNTSNNATENIVNIINNVNINQQSQS